jgi:hypothetical protein
MTATATQPKPSPEQMIGIMRKIDESMFGQQKWNDLLKKTDDDMQQLISIGVISKRDKYIMQFALHMGIQYGVAYSRALRNAQKPLNIIKKFFTRKERK